MKGKKEKREKEKDWMINSGNREEGEEGKRRKGNMKTGR